MTNARYQRTRPMTNGRAPEQPHYAVITEDGWPSAPPPQPPAYPLRRLWEPIRLHPPGREPRCRPSRQSWWARPRCPGREPGAQAAACSGGTKRRAQREQGAHWASGLPEARTRSCAHTWPAHAPAACVLARCTCSSCPGTTPTSQDHRHRLLRHAWAYICHQIWVHTHQQKSKHTEPCIPRHRPFVRGPIETI